MKTLGMLLDRLKSSLRNDTCILCEQAMPLSMEETICMACEKRIRLRQTLPVIKTTSGPIYAACEFPYRIKRLIYDLKFEQKTGNSLVLADILVHYWHQTGMDKSAKWIVLPVPPHINSAGVGFSHAGMIARPFASRFGYDYAEDVLIWNHPVEPQHLLLSRRKRNDNMKGAFTVNQANLCRFGKQPRFLVIDDLLTTGATLISTLAALKKDVPGSESAGLTVARVPLHNAHFSIEN
jgi:predicted amidophosphoribosyltransferase